MSFVEKLHFGVESWRPIWFQSGAKDSAKAQVHPSSFAELTCLQLNLDFQIGVAVEFPSPLHQLMDCTLLTIRPRHLLHIGGDENIASDKLCLLRLTTSLIWYGYPSN